jgi:hypothetical protein
MIQDTTQEVKKVELLSFNYDSFEHALIVNNYPYGFRLRTDIKYWVETKGNKQRLGTCTLNPKTNKWNAPKYSTYSNLVMLYREYDTGHVKSYSFNIAYSDEEDDKKLMALLGDCGRSAYIDDTLKYLKAVRETQKHISVEIRPESKEFKHKVTGEIVRQVPLMQINDYEEVTEAQKDAEQKEIKQSINKLFVHNMLKEGLTVDDIKRVAK